MRWRIILAGLALLMMGAWWGSTGFKRNDLGEITPSDEGTISGSFILPDCPADLAGLRFGALCKNTGTGKIIIRDGGGVREL